MILAQDPNKKIILILNKIDLVPKENVEKWLKYLRNDYPTLAFKCSTQKKGKLGQAAASLQTVSASVLQDTSECLGADTLIQLLKNYSRSLNMKTSITVGIIGYPNVGKSSLINSLKRERAVGFGATPGYTRAMQQVHIDKHVKLLDCPGIVFSESSSESDLVLRNCIKIEQITDTVKPVETILSRCRREKLMEIYKIPVYHDVKEFLCHIAHKRGKLGKGGVPEYEAAARTVLQDWNAGKIAFYTEPPREKKGVHLSATVVSQFSQEIKLDEIFLNEETSVLAGLNTDNDKFMPMGNSVFSSTVDTNLMRHLGTEDDMGELDDDSSTDQPRYMFRGDENAGEQEEEDQMVVAQNENASSVLHPQQRKLEEDEDKLNLKLDQSRRKQLKALRKMRRKDKGQPGLADGHAAYASVEAGPEEQETFENAAGRLGLFTQADLMAFLEQHNKKKKKGKEKDAGGEDEAEELVTAMDEEEELAGAY